jgi:hypothetical protein
MFYTQDMRMLVKTIDAAECRFLCRVADRYEAYLRREPSSFLVKFFGLHALSLYSRRFYFVVMGNHFPPKLKIHRTFDIKGSWEGRSGKPPYRGQRVTCRHCNAEYRYAAQSAGGAGTLCPQRVGGHQPNIVLKDNDLTERLRLSHRRARVVYGQLCRDAALLAGFGATDYSLLLGVHNVEYDCTVQYEQPPAPQDEEVVQAFDALQQHQGESYRPPSLEQEQQQQQQQEEQQEQQQQREHLPSPTDSPRPPSRSPRRNSEPSPEQHSPRPPPGRGGLRDTTLGELNVALSAYEAQQGGGGGGGGGGGDGGGGGGGGDGAGGTVGVGCTVNASSMALTPKAHRAPALQRRRQQQQQQQQQEVAAAPLEPVSRMGAASSPVLGARSLPPHIADHDDIFSDWSSHDHLRKIMRGGGDSASVSEASSVESTSFDVVDLHDSLEHQLRSQQQQQQQKQQQRQRQKHRALRSAQGPAPPCTSDHAPEDKVPQVRGFSNIALARRIVGPAV